MKVEEQVKFLETHRTGIGVGTPARLADLVENGTFLTLAPENRLVFFLAGMNVDMEDRCFESGQPATYRR